MTANESSDKSILLWYIYNRVKVTFHCSLPFCSTPNSSFSLATSFGFSLADEWDPVKVVVLCHNYPIWKYFPKINVEISNNQESADISSIDSRTKPTFVYCLGIFKIIGSAVFADNHFSIVKFGTCPNSFIYFWVNLNFRWNRESEIFSLLDQSQPISRI